MMWVVNPSKDLLCPGQDASVSGRGRWTPAELVAR